MRENKGIAPWCICGWGGDGPCPCHNQRSIYPPPYDLLPRNYPPYNPNRDIFGPMETDPELLKKLEEAYKSMNDPVEVQTFGPLKDQSNKADSGKIKPRLLLDDMALAIQHVSAVLTYGAEKYEERGWRKVDKDRYEDAQYRHHLALANGESHDEESGLHHLAHIACNAMFLLQMELEKLGSNPPEWKTPPQDHKEGARD